MLKKLSLKARIYISIAKIWGKVYPKLIRKIKPDELSYGEITGRIVEYPFVFKSIRRLKTGRILDVSCGRSSLPTELAALGFEVHAIDIVPYPVRYPRVKVIQGDIRKTNYPDNFFDVVTAISTIEHIGKPEAYGIHKENPEEDKKAIREITRILKHGGEK